ncbi:MAG: hypothetical protein H0T42_26700 [Deltaproteobacteria bacterium]|nr:hypothetical protein [Deltaproteobacteria bacterium]
MRTILLLLLLWSAPAFAQNALTITEVKVDRPTLHTVGIQVLISGDANRNASIAVRVGTTDALPLFRVRPETVTGRTVPEQLAGTIFDLVPGSTYDVELIATDPDGGSTTRQVQVKTRPLPRDPITPNVKAVTTAAELRTALQMAQPGDVITLADGVYVGPFTLMASGTADNPIVVRGASQTGTILDGDDCGGCNIVEAAVSHVHIERLTIRNGVRGLRFLGNETTANAVTRVTIENVVHGIGSGTAQTDFTICDNVIKGRLAWPLLSSDDGAIHNDDQGIRVDGSGHVVCHNDIAGFGDPMLNFAEGGRAYDFYGNDIHEIYGDGTELDRGEGNVRLFGNRFTNVYTAISIQPAYGGPVYVLRNQAVNVYDEQIKLKSVGGTVEPSGVLIYHNTFVSPRMALNLQTPITQHNFVIANNLFVGPASPAGRNVEWTAAIDGGEFDYNGYYPDSGYWLGTVGTARSFATLATAPAGVEDNGVVLGTPAFAPAFAPPASYTTQVLPPQLELAATSNAHDVGRVLPGINARHDGAGPDLGARESLCPEPHYGPRPAGSETITTKIDCAADDVDPGGDGPPGGADLTGSDPDGGGCCDSGRGLRGSLLLIAVVGLLLGGGTGSARSASSSDLTPEFGCVDPALA